MALRPVGADLLHQNLVPQAVLGVSEAQMRERFILTKGVDDFDEFVGAAFIADDTTEFTLKHYVGHPPDTFTMYLRPNQLTVEQITGEVYRLVDELDLPRGSVVWERSQDPDL